MGDHTLIWDVSRLVDLARDIPVTLVRLSKIHELDEPYWFAATHMKQVTAADLSDPVILYAKGRIMDGMHRVAKALNEGQGTIAARRFSETPSHNFINITPEDLDYCE